MLRTTALRTLTDADLPRLLALLDQDPVTNCFVTGRVQAAGLEPRRLGAELWGYVDRDDPNADLLGACYVGANLVPVSGPRGHHDGLLRAFADRGRKQGRRCWSMVGPTDLVAPLWELLERSWGPARVIRARQPLMAVSEPSAVAANPEVRRVRLDELETLLPAAVAMHTEEIGVSPMASGGRLYRARVADLIRAGRSFAHIDGGRVLFKAEIGASTERACQVQGVWTAPELRGQGIATAGMAAVVDIALREIAPVVSLYVNDYNLPARRAYAKVGFRDVGCFTSIMF